ncbi:MAG: DUF4976 domain-containing protein, partial [Planctomycetaceae bacterium]
LHRPILELYDLETDPWEVNNLADDKAVAEVKARMVAELLQRLTDTHDPWLQKYHPLRTSQSQTN